MNHHPLDNNLLLGRYRVMRLLGEGGMGTVHLARVEGAEGFTRPVVVKRMKRDIGITEEGNRLFIREAKILSKLRHPGIVGISDFGVEDGAHIMVLEYVHGYALSTWLEYRYRKKDPLPVDVCLFIVRRILDALSYAHHFDTEEGREIEIVHRDVSPDNVLLSNKGYVHLLDFGIASMRGPDGAGSTKSGAFRGKLCYAAPETLKGEPATPRSDQYSAAVVLLELLTSQTPFSADSIAETFERMLNEVPPPPSKTRDDIPNGLDAVLARALEKDPKARFDAALTFSRELRRFQQDDDEEVAERMKELLREEFELLPELVGVEGLREREAALERILSIAPGPLTHRATAALFPTMLDRDFAPPVHPDTPATLVTPAVPTAQKQLHGLLLGLLIVGGLIAVGLGAAVALLSRGGTEEQVVIVGGERTDAEFVGKKANGEVESADTTPETPRTATEDALVDPTPEATVDPEAQTGASESSQKKPAPETRTDQNALASAVKQKSGAFQSCFAQHIDREQAPPEAVLHFSVAKQGGSAQVNVEPPALAATPLGGCLKGAARQVQFPKLSESVAFQVPVRARVSRSKNEE